MHQLILNQSECNLMQRSNSHQANLHQLTELLSSIRFAYTQIQICGHNLHLFVAASSEKKKFQFVCLRSRLERGGIEAIIS